MVNFKSKAKAKEVILTWDLNKEADIAGYNIYRGRYKINQELITDLRAVIMNIR